MGRPCLSTPGLIVSTEAEAMCCSDGIYKGFISTPSLTHKLSRLL